MSYFSSRLRDLRKQNGYTQTELAAALGVARSSVSMYETASREPDFETLEMIADFFNVPISSLVDAGSRQELPPAETEGLSSEETRLLKLFRQLSDDKKETLIALMRQLVNNQ